MQKGSKKKFKLFNKKNSSEYLGSVCLYLTSLQGSQASFLVFFFLQELFHNFYNSFVLQVTTLPPNCHFTLVFYSTPYAKVFELYLFCKPDLPFIHVPLVALHHLASVLVILWCQMKCFSIAVIFHLK